MLLKVTKCEKYSYMKEAMYVAPTIRRKRCIKAIREMFKKTHSDTVKLGDALLEEISSQRSKSQDMI